MSRSNWLKNRWRKAKELQHIYNTKNDENLSVRDFFKNENPFTKNMVKYEITYKLDYTKFNSAGFIEYKFFIPQETITFYAPKTAETKTHLEQKVKDGIKSVFRGKSIEWIDKNVIVRGVEVENINYNELNPEELKHHNQYTNDNKKINVIKKVKDYEHKNDYDLKLWL